jgi:hypothetical protein
MNGHNIDYMELVILCTVFGSHFPYVKLISLYFDDLRNPNTMIKNVSTNSNILFLSFDKSAKLKEYIVVYVAMPQVIKLFFLDLGGSI